jgi:hypothetical protein
MNYNRPGSPPHGGNRPPSAIELDDQFGRIMRELAELAASVSGLHVKSDIIAQSFKRLADDRMRDRFDLERYGRRIAAIEHQLALVSQKPDLPDWQPDPKEVTGTHDFAVIKAQFEELRTKQAEEEKRKFDSGIWWKRQRWIWIVALLFLFVSTCLGACSAYIMHNMLQESRPAESHPSHAASAAK